MDTLSTDAAGDLLTAAYYLRTSIEKQRKGVIADRLSAIEREVNSLLTDWQNQNSEPTLE